MIIKKKNKKYYKKKYSQYSIIIKKKQKKIFCFFPYENTPKNLSEWINGIYNGIEILKKLNKCPVIGLISGGRISDYGRDKEVDKTIKNSNEIYNYFLNKGFNIYNYSILIEEAIIKSNLLVISDAISCKLIVKTLINIGKYKKINL